MPPISVTIFASDPGRYTLRDNGTVGDSFSQIAFPGGAFVSFEHPTDDLIFDPSVAGVILDIDLVDPLGGSRFRAGDLADSTSCPDIINIGAIESDVLVALVANTRINELGSDDAADVSAGSLILSATTGIGVGNTLETATVTLEGRTSTGGIDLVNEGAVSIGGLDAGLNGLSVATSGNVKLLNYGSISLSDTDGSEVVKAGSTLGNIELTAVGTASNIQVLADNDAMTAARGKITLTAGQDVLVGTAGANFDNDVRANGDIKITAGRDFIVDGFADIVADDFGQGTGGNLIVTAGRNITVDDAQGEDASLFANGTAGGDIRLTTGAAGALSLRAAAAFDTAVTSHSGDVLAQADRLIIDSDSGMTATLGSITVRPVSLGLRIDLGSLSDVGPAMGISDAELDRLFAGFVTIGGADAGQITVSASVSGAGLQDLTLRSGSSILVNNGVTVGAISDLAMLAADDILMGSTAAIAVGGVFDGFVDFGDDDAGVGGKAIVGAGLATAVRFVGAADNDTLQGGAGSDVLDGGGGADLMTGRLGDDTYTFTTGDIIVEFLGEGTDTVLSAGNATLADNLENLTLTGVADADGTGNDLANTITGNSGNNVLVGGKGNDTINGGLGKDEIDGGKDKDRINGGDGADTINGGLKSDRLTGGTGADRFLFDTAPSTVVNSDEIQDYSTAQDTIALDNAVFAALGAAGTLAAGRFHIGPAAADGNDFIIYDNVTGALLYDADGNGGGAAIQFATVNAGLAMTNADFLVV